MNHLDSTTLNLYLDDALDAKSRAAADAHLALCETCQHELDVLQSLVVAFDSWRAEPIPRDLSVPVMTRIATRPAPALVSRWAAVLLAVQVLFAALLLIWLLPMLLRAFNGLPFEFVPTIDVSAFVNDLRVTNSFNVPLPPVALWIWIVALVSIALAWLVGNRLVLTSLETTRNTSQEASQ